MEFDKSYTYKNIDEAFRAKCVSFTLYMLFGQKARQDDWHQLADIFAQSAKNELEHSRIFYNILYGESSLSDTCENLARGAQMEKAARETYAKFAQIAKEESFFKISALLEEIQNIDAAHMKRFAVIRENMDKANTFCRNEKQKWICSCCGHEKTDFCSDAVCPVCGACQGYSRIKAENY